MPLRMIAVEKQAEFQGRTETWSNVYCYDMPDVSLAAHQALEQLVLDAERPVHHTSVKFIRTRTYTTEGLNTGDEGTMYNITERNVFGTGPIGPGYCYKECAVLVKWPLPRKVKLGGGLGRQRSLKKWIHSIAVSGATTAMNSGDTALDASAKAPYTTYAAAVRTPGSNKLVTPSDSSEPSGVAIIQPYLEHRQFPRGRKEGIL